MAHATTAAAPAAESKVNTFLAQVYLLMFVGLAVTGVVSYWVSENTAFESLLATSPALVWGLWIVQVILVHVISVRVMKITPGAAALLFLLYAALTGWFLAWLASALLSWLFGLTLTNVNWALNFIGIAIFVALTAWDTNQLKKIGQQIDDHPHGGGLVVIGALKLYLDYINLFLLLLRARSR